MFSQLSTMYASLFWNGVKGQDGIRFVLPRIGKCCNLRVFGANFLGPNLYLSQSSVISHCKCSSMKVKLKTATSCSRQEPWSFFWLWTGAKVVFCTVLSSEWCVGSLHFVDCSNPVFYSATLILLQSCFCNFLPSQKRIQTSRIHDYCCCSCASQKIRADKQSIC